jgi:hypothetical protein
VDKNTYVPLNQLIQDKDTSWTFTRINLPYHEIAKQGIVIWCVENLEGRWTMLGGNKFGFEDGTDATMFKIQFGLGLPAV